MKKAMDSPVVATDVGGTKKLIDDYLSANPQLADALKTFEVAQSEYRRSLAAMTSIKVCTSATTNIEA